MKNIIEELYSGNIHPLEEIAYTKQMKEIVGYISRHKETLQGELDDNGKETFEKLIDNFYEYCSLLSHETFNYSIKLGANLILDLIDKGGNDE